MKEQTVSPTRVIITVDDDNLKTINEVAANLIAIGVKNTNILKNIGIINGDYAGDLKDLQKIKGVLSAERERMFYLN